MAIKVKSVERAAQKFIDRAAVAGKEYEQGVRETSDWEQKAIAAKAAYEAGISDAISRGAREAGISKAGNSKWQTKAVTLGVKRFPEGVRAAKGDYTREVAPYLQTIASLELPPRGPKGSPENFERVRIIGEALRQKKLSG
jgi:hypothetical protein